jgi:hypothetical protein
MRGTTPMVMAYFEFLLGRCFEVSTMILTDELFFKGS